MKQRTPPVKMLFENGDTRQRIYNTARGRAIAIAQFVRSGFKYFITYNDRLGFGLDAVRQASWQCESSKPVREAR